MEPRSASYAAMGAQWSLRIWDALGEAAFAELAADAERYCAAFEATYSRFKPNSLIHDLAGRTGVIAVPPSFVEMLRIYERVNALSDGACNPLIGAALSDLGYDASYSLQEQRAIRPVPDFPSAVQCVDDEHIRLCEPVAFDLGALGKGFAVDQIAATLTAKGIRRFLVDGSGDIVYSGDGVAIRAGLEHPDDATKAIGVIELLDGAFCASASNRRRWGTHHHIVHPASLQSPSHILATWVRSESAAIADIAATTLFLADADVLATELGIEYCMLSDTYHVRHSPGFIAEFF